MTLETEVHNEQERFRALFENSIDAVLLINGEGTIEAANPEARQLFSRTEEEIFQLNWTELLDSTDNRLKSLLTEREQSGRFKGELGCRRKDGSIFLGEVSGTSYRDKTGLLKAYPVVADNALENNARAAMIDVILRRGVLAQDASTVKALSTQRDLLQRAYKRADAAHH